MHGAATSAGNPTGWLEGAFTRIERVLIAVAGAAILVSGGITGALAALRSAPKRKDFVAVGYELFDATRAALIDGTLTMVISHPMETFAREAIAAMIRAKRSGPEGGAQRVALGFDIYTSENV